MIKMQIVMDKDRIAREQKYNPDKIQAALDNYMVEKLHLQKEDEGFYLGTNPQKDFSRFGLAFSTLSDQEWFLANVKTWLYFNSDSSDDPNDFVIEDFKDFCLRQSAAV